MVTVRLRLWERAVESSLRQVTTGAENRESDLAKSLLSRARAMVPALAERAVRAEQDRRIPKETIADFKEAGFFRALQPQRYGGYELDPQVFFDLQATLAEGCMSSGWVFG